MFGFEIAKWERKLTNACRKKGIFLFVFLIINTAFSRSVHSAIRKLRYCGAEFSVGSFTDLLSLVGCKTLNFCQYGKLEYIYSHLLSRD